MACYICNEPKFVIRRGTVRDDASLKVQQCVRCGLVYLSSTSHIAKGHYENSGMHSEHSTTIESWLQSAQEDDNRRFELLRTSMQGKKVLDFGCGAGGFLNIARSVANSVAGVEPETRVRNYWNGQLRIFPNINEIQEDYNIITAFHVIEHLQDPRSMLAQLAGKLSDKGKIIIEVPNSDDALLTLYETPIFENFTYWSQHLYLFNAHTLKILSEQSGLRVVAIQQVQRYPISNHLYWLSKSKPGGQDQWPFLNDSVLRSAYSMALASIGKCDTIIAHLERP